jgi:pimeloyl-ACP methyl ester carboxylesterase
MDAAGCERAFLFGESEGGNMACMFAATHPERVLGLMLWGTMPCQIVSPDAPWGIGIEELHRMADDVASNGFTRAFMTGRVGGMAGATDDEIAEMSAYFRASAGPTQMAALLRMLAELDVRPILGAVNMPTLVMIDRERPGCIREEGSRGVPLSRRVMTGSLAPVDRPGRLHRGSLGENAMHRREDTQGMTSRRLR